MRPKRKRKGGVYVWRTKKPGALIGLPFTGCLAGAVVACVWLHVIGVAWFIGLAVLLFSGTHFAYVGETVSFYHRERQHRGNLDTEDEFKSTGQPWADLNAKIVMRIPLPTSARSALGKRVQKMMLRSVESFFIVIFAPVYNDAKNRWNPRRIPKAVAKAQRAARDRRARKGGLRWSLNFRSHHALGVVIGGILLVVFVIF